MTFDEAIQALADERRIDRADVLAAALQRKIWVCEWHIPGCLSESHAVCLTKAGAIEQAVSFTGADGSGPIEHKTRGIVTALRTHGQFEHHTELFGNVITTIERMTLGELL